MYTFIQIYQESVMKCSFTVRKRNNLTTSVTLLDELPVSDLFFTDKEPDIFPIENGQS